MNRPTLNGRRTLSLVTSDPPEQLIALGAKSGPWYLQTSDGSNLVMTTIGGRSPPLISYCKFDPARHCFKGLMFKKGSCSYAVEKWPLGCLRHIVVVFRVVWWLALL